MKAADILLVGPVEKLMVVSLAAQEDPMKAEKNNEREMA